VDPEAFAAVLKRYRRWWERGRVVDEGWLDSYSDRAQVVARDPPAGEVEAEPSGPPPALYY
jgi:hypothetical protein